MSHLLELAEKAVSKRKEAYKIRMYTNASMGVDLDTCLVVYYPGQTHKVDPEKMETYLNASIEMSEMLINSVKTKQFNTQEYQEYKDILFGCVIEAAQTPESEFPRDETEVEKPFDEGNEEGRHGTLPNDVKPVEKQMDAEEKTIAPIEEEVELHDGEPVLASFDLEGEDGVKTIKITKYKMIELLESSNGKRARNKWLKIFKELNIDEEIINEVDTLTN